MIWGYPYFWKHPCVFSATYRFFLWRSVRSIRFVCVFWRTTSTYQVIHHWANCVADVHWCFMEFPSWIQQLIWLDIHHLEWWRIFVQLYHVGHLIFHPLGNWTLLWTIVGMRKTRSKSMARFSSLLCMEIKLRTLWKRCFPTPSFLPLLAGWTTHSKKTMRSRHKRESWKHTPSLLPKNRQKISKIKTPWSNLFMLLFLLPQKRTFWTWKRPRNGKRKGQRSKLSILGFHVSFFLGGI